MDTKEIKGWNGLGNQDCHKYTTMYKMRTYCIAQRTLFSALWLPTWEGNPQKWGHMYMHN